MNHPRTSPMPQRGKRSRYPVLARSGRVHESRWLNARVWRKAAAGRTRNVCGAAAGSRGQRCRPEGFVSGKRLLEPGAAGGKARLGRPQGEARQYRETLARLPRWFGALIAILANALPARLRGISQVTSWSASSLPPLLRGAVVAVCYFVFAKVSLTLAS